MEARQQKLVAKNSHVTVNFKGSNAGSFYYLLSFFSYEVFPVAQPPGIMLRIKKAYYI
jgi:hypothetical protein